MPVTRNDPAASTAPPGVLRTVDDVSRRPAGRARILTPVCTGCGSPFRID